MSQSQPDDSIQVEPFFGQLTGEHIRQLIQQRLAQDHFQIANILAPESTPFLRHAELSSAIFSIRERERCGR